MAAKDLRSAPFKEIRSQRGVTLVELSIVLAALLIAVAACVALFVRVKEVNHRSRVVSAYRAVPSPALAGFGEEGELVISEDPNLDLLGIARGTFDTLSLIIGDNKLKACTFFVATTGVCSGNNDKSSVGFILMPYTTSDGVEYVNFAQGEDQYLQDNLLPNCRCSIDNDKVEQFFGVKLRAAVSCQPVTPCFQAVYDLPEEASCAVLVQEKDAVVQIMPCTTQSVRYPSGSLVGEPPFPSSESSSSSSESSTSESSDSSSSTLSEVSTSSSSDSSSSASSEVSTSSSSDSSSSTSSEVSTSDSSDSSSSEPSVSSV